MTDLYHASIMEYASALPPNCPQRTTVQKWWYIETVKMIITDSTFWYAIAEEAVYNCIVPLWKNGIDFCGGLVPAESLNIVDIRPESLKITLVNLYRVDTNYRTLARQFLPMGTLEHEHTSLNYDEYTLKLRDGFSTPVRIFIYSNLDCFRPHITAESLLFSRYGWHVAGTNFDCFSPVEITPTVDGASSTTCHTNWHRSVLNILNRIDKKQLVILPDSTEETVEKYLESGWVSAPETFIEFSKDHPSDALCDTCEEEITNWSARSKLHEIYYHPTCVPTL